MTEPRKPAGPSFSIPVPKLRRHKPSRRACASTAATTTWGPGPTRTPRLPKRCGPPTTGSSPSGSPPTALPSPRRANCGGKTLAADADPGRAPEGVTVAELVLAFLRHAEAYYRHTDGTPTGDVDNYRYAFRPLVHLCGGKEARRFRPGRLKAVRRLMVRGYTHPDHGVQAALSRKLVNSRCARIVRLFRWAVEEGMVPARVWQRLTAVRKLKRGRSEARETERVRPARPAHVEAVVARVWPAVAAMIRLQILSGLRPGEVCRLRPADLDRASAAGVWLYRPPKHKTAHREKERVVALGPRAQAVILDFVDVRCPGCGRVDRPPRMLSPDGARCGPCAGQHDHLGIEGPWPRCEAADAGAALFSPRRAMRERDEDRRSSRKTRVQPSQRCRKEPGAKRRPQDAYDTRALNRAIARACAEAGVEPWSPNRLRHLHGTEVRRRYGLEGAQVALGHARANVTELYAETDLDFAAQIAREIG